MAWGYFGLGCSPIYPDYLEVDVVFFANCRGETLSGRNQARNMVPFKFNSRRAEGNRIMNLVHR